MMQISSPRVPPASALFEDYLNNWQSVERFYPQHYSIESIARFAAGRPRPGPSHLDLLCSVLAEQQKRWGASRDGVEKLGAGAVAVVTGQQPGLFTGSHLSILKAISAIKLARSLEHAGVRAVPVFWVAAEDHDHVEIESTWILNRDSGLTRIHVDLSNAEPTPAGWAQFRDDAHDAVSECLSNLPQSEFIPEVKDLLESCYKPGASPVDAFAGMMARLFPNSGLIFVDPLNMDLKRLAQPVIELAVRKNSEMRAAIIARSRSLTEAGYHEQVKVDENFTGFFAYSGKSRRVVRPGELSADLHWSPNVLLRPVVQDTIFPTAAYVGGPAEIAYFAQGAAVYETLRIVMPPVFPRISATILEPRVARALEKHGISLDDVFHGRDFLKRKAVEKLQGGEAFDRSRGRIEAQMESLRPVFASADPTLLGALETSLHKILHQMETLRTKYVNAVAKRNDTMERHLEAIVNSLFPERKLQERVINITSFLARYGLRITEGLENTLNLEAREHQLVEI